VAYSTVERVQQALARNTQDTAGTAASLGTDVILQNIAEADREIDGRLTSIYSTPFNPVPETIQDISTAIAAYLSDLTYREVRDYANPQANPVVLRYQRAQALLKSLASGEMDLVGATPTSDQGGNGRIVATFDGGASFDDFDFDLHRYRSPNRPAGVNNDRSSIWGIW